MSPKIQGNFIVIDGPDGAGKSTVIKGVQSALLAEGLPVVLTREPGGSPYAEKVRDVILSDDAEIAEPETMLLLFMAARLEHVAKTIRPALARGKIVLCDRFDSTTYAYQIVAEERPDLAPRFDALRFDYRTTLPNYILLDVSPEMGRMRLKDRAEKLNHFDKRSSEWHARARQGFQDFLLEVCPEGTYDVVDAEQAREVVLLDTLAAVRKVLAQN